MATATRIMMFTDAVTAEERFGYYKGQGIHNVVLTGPCDIIRTSGTAPSKIEWDSGASVDWYMLVISPARVLVSGGGVQRAD